MVSTKTIWIEQKKADMSEVDCILNRELHSLEDRGHVIKDLRIAVGRDADVTAKLEKRFALTAVILYS